MNKEILFIRLKYLISVDFLNHSKKLLEHLKEISVIDFDHSDVVRHPLVSKIVKAYSDQKTNND